MAGKLDMKSLNGVFLPKFGYYYIRSGRDRYLQNGGFAAELTRRPVEAFVLRSWLATLARSNLVNYKLTLCASADAALVKI